MKEQDYRNAAKNLGQFNHLCRSRRNDYFLSIIGKGKISGALAEAAEAFKGLGAALRRLNSKSTQR